MRYGLKSIAAPAEEPVTLDEAKAQCRVTQNADDAQLTSFIVAAREYVEVQTARQIITATWEAAWDHFPYGPDQETYRPLGSRFGIIRVPLAPLVSVTSIKYVDPDGATQTLDPTLYQIDTYFEPGRIAPSYNNVWPVTRESTFNAVIVRFVAGYGLHAAVPQKLKQAILLLIGHLYENRESTVSGTIIAEIPKGLDSFIRSAGYKEYV